MRSHECCHMCYHVSSHYNYHVCFHITTSVVTCVITLPRVFSPLFSHATTCVVTLHLVCVESSVVARAARRISADSSNEFHFRRQICRKRRRQRRFRHSRSRIGAGIDAHREKGRKNIFHGGWTKLTSSSDADDKTVTTKRREIYFSGL